MNDIILNPPAWPDPDSSELFVFTADETRKWAIWIGAVITYLNENTKRCQVEQ